MKFGTVDGEGTALQIYRFYHLKDANQVFHLSISFVSIHVPWVIYSSGNNPVM